MTFSRMTLGEPMLKAAAPPRKETGGGPCVNPHVTGANILPDGGFENQLALYGGGPTGVEIPMSSFSKNLKWSDLSPAPAGSPWATGTFTPTTPGRFVISTAAPDTGTYHLRHVTDDNVWTAVEYVYAVSASPCASPPYTKMTAVVNPGDFVSISLRAKASVLTYAPYLNTVITFYTSAGSSLGDFYGVGDGSSGDFLTTSYATYTHPGVFAPATSAWVSCAFWDFPDTTPSASHNVDIDNVTVDVV